MKLLLTCLLFTSMIILQSCGSNDYVGSTTETLIFFTQDDTNGGNAANINGVSFILQLPNGVTIDKVTNETSSSETTIGQAINVQVFSNYSTSTTDAHVSIANATPIIGPMAYVKCTIAPNTLFTPTDALISNFKAYDGNGSQIPGISGHIRVLGR